MPLLTLLIIWSMFAQVALTVVVLLKMRKARVKAFIENNMTKEQIAVNHDAWPEEVRKIQNNYANQFEIPVLFFIASVIVLMFGLEGLLFVVLAWAFVIARIVHMVIHTGPNKIKFRFRAFLASLICVVLQWLYIVGMATLAYLQGIPT